MNPLNNETTEKEFDAKLKQLDDAGYTWDGCIPVAPNGYKFYGIMEKPFFAQVEYVYSFSYKLGRNK